MPLKVTADKIRRARIANDDIENFVSNDVIFVQFDGRQPEAFTGDMGAKSLPPSRATTEVHPVATADGKSEQLVVEEYRHGKRNVIDVRTALVRIIENNDIAGSHLFNGKFPNRCIGAVLHRRQMHRIAGLANKAKVSVIDGVREIEHVGEDRRE